jgi:hypothetical protein
VLFSWRLSFQGSDSSAFSTASGLGEASGEDGFDESFFQGSEDGKLCGCVWVCECGRQRKGLKVKISPVFIIAF